MLKTYISKKCENIKKTFASYYKNTFICKILFYDF